MLLRLCGYGLLLTMVLAGSTALGQDAWGERAGKGQEEIGDILSRVQAHDETCRTLDVTYMIGHRFALDVAARAAYWRRQGRETSSVETWGPKDRDMKGRFLIDGVRLRKNVTAITLDEDGQETGRETMYALYTGDSVKRLEVERKRGLVGPPEERNPIILQELQPLHWGSSYGAQPLGEFLGEGTIEKVTHDRLDDTRVIILDFVSKYDQRFRFWLAPDCGYRFIRLERYRESRLFMRFEVELAEHNGNWFPKHGTWTAYNLTDDGGPEIDQTAELTVESVTMNEPISEEDMTFEFPIGTLVSDMFLGIGYRTSDSGAELQGSGLAAGLRAPEDGPVEEPNASLSEETVTDDANGANGEPAQAAPGSSSPESAGTTRSRSWICGALVAVAVGGVVAAVLRPKGKRVG